MRAQMYKGQKPLNEMGDKDLAKFYERNRGKWLPFSVGSRGHQSQGPLSRCLAFSEMSRSGRTQRQTRQVGTYPRACNVIGPLNGISEEAKENVIERFNLYLSTTAILYVKR